MSLPHQDCEGPVVLQLRRWDPSQPRFDPSEFSQGFLSPTRELLLLLSHHRDALLLPLTGGSLECIHNEDFRRENGQNSDSLSSSVPSIPSTSGSWEDAVFPEPRPTISSGDFCPESGVTEFSSCYISDVHSSTWAVYGDTNRHYKEPAFREFLFVAGNSGVIVHAFRQLYEGDEISESSVGAEDRHSRWVEWAPSSAPSFDARAYDGPTNSGKSSKDEGLHGSGEPSTAHSRKSISRKWLHSVLTSVETCKKEGTVWTMLPKASSFPTSAKVVSFHIFGNDSSILGFLSHGNSVIHDGVGEENQYIVVDECCTAAGRDSKSDGSLSISSGFQCLKIFSSNPGHLIGFVLTNASDASNATESVACRNLNKIILVSRLGISGIQWLCSVKLGQHSMGVVCDWTDFQFSDNLLVCLSAAGVISFYDATEGIHVASLNILETLGLKPERDLHEGETMLHIDDFQDEKGEPENISSKSGGHVHKRVFHRLLAASDTSFLAIVDQHSAVYAICVWNHVPEKYYSFRQLPSKVLGHEELFPWAVGNSDISCQRLVMANSFSYSNSWSKRFSKMNGCGEALQAAHSWCHRGRVNQNDLSLSGFAKTSKKTTCKLAHSRCSRNLRNIFLPSSRGSASDTLSFSRFGITRLTRRIHIDGRKHLCVSHTSLRIGETVYDDGSSRTFGNFEWQNERETFIGEAVGCTFQGCFYLVTASGLSVVLPFVSVSLDFHPVESIAYPLPRSSDRTTYVVGELLKVRRLQQILPAWKVEVLDRILLFEGSDEADRLCLENGWDLRASRLRHLQLALGYLKFDMVEWSLEALANVDMAEEGMLRLILAAVYMMFDRSGNDNEVSVASRLLALASCFATKMIRDYAILEHNTNNFEVESKVAESQYLEALLPSKELDRQAYARRLHAMSHLLVITRNLQRRLAAKYGRPVKGSVYDGEGAYSLDTILPENDAQLLLDAADSRFSEKLNNLDSAMLELDYVTAEKLETIPTESLDQMRLSNLDVKGMALAATEAIPKIQNIRVENPREMIARWKVDNMDLKNIVEDALRSGRLPLAVLQLHLHRSEQMNDEDDPNDTFTKVQDVGRTIAYDLFLKGETGLAVTALQKLGEDVETCLRQLLFGTVNRSLRNQIASEMKKYGFLRSYELALLDRISVIERIYPSCKFWRTYTFQRKESEGHLKTAISSTSNSLRLLHPHIFRNLLIECGEVDGVVLGSWTNLNGTSASSEEEDNSDVGYWASAVVWSNAWDQKTFDRILLDQPFVMGIHVMWESQFDYYLCHNDWEEVYKLLDMIPSSLTPVRSLHIGLDGLKSSSSYGGNLDYSDYRGYVCAPEELDVVYCDIPSVRIFQSSAHSLSSTWLRMLLEKELAKKFIFCKEYWDGVGDIISLMARSGFIVENNKKPFQNESCSSDLDFIDLGREFQPATVWGFHKLVIYHCTQHNLPFLMDLYLDHHNLALNDESLDMLLESAGDCEWAKWLLLSRVRGHEYDASFSNARAIISRDLVHAHNLTAPLADDIIHTVDDIAESGWLMASLASMMFAPLPMQSCLSSGSVKRRFSSSAQCTLENLRPALQGFPTLWRMLVSACLGNDTAYEFWGPKIRTVVGSSALSIYLHWRDSIFYSCGHDCSLLQMLPWWFPRGLRRLIQLYVQGPFGWHAMADLSIGEAYVQRDVDYLINDGQYSEFSALSWEAAIQKQIEQELYASFDESELGLEHHLHRGRALAALNHLIGYRVQKLKSENVNGTRSISSIRGQMNIQMDVQTLLAPLTQSEESLLSVVHPLAITNYENSTLVASCAFLLELCGLSAARLHVDIAVLKRISEFYMSDMKVELQNQVSIKDSKENIADLLARSLADSYLQQDNPNGRKGSHYIFDFRHPSQALLPVLHHLEKASLPDLADGMTYGSWLLSGDGDGSYIRSRQIAASQRWNLVTAFCQMHQIPLSTKYLASLAGDNDWVGFLSEAQIGGYPFETVIQVAANEFSDSGLRTHILTVLRSMQSKKKSSASPMSDGTEDQFNTLSQRQGFRAPELFEILAECEKQKQPGKALLVKAKRLRWSMLAIIASCFPDVTPLSCLTVWLEIAAGRDASSAKANDIANWVANSIRAAVDATNSLSDGDRVATLHYNQTKAKRQRLIDSVSASSVSAKSDSFCPRVNIVGVEETREAPHDSEEWPLFLPKMLSMLCERQQFLPLLRGFEMFLPSCSLLPFIRALQAFSQMRLSEASAHLESFSNRIKEEPGLLVSNSVPEGQFGSWISSTAKKAADSVLFICPSPYEKRCLLQLLSSTDFGDGGSTATYYRQQYWKINLAEPSLRKNENLQLGNETLDDASLLTALEKNGHWEQARNWARQLEASGGPWKFAVHHVTESQAESMVAEWKEFLWDVPEERVALWGHCQTLFIRYSFPSLQAGLFFLKHAEAVEKNLPARELHELLLLSLQWLSGMITQSSPVCPLHLLREIETRVWLLAVESEGQVKSERDINMSGSSQDQMRVKSSSIIDRTATIITKMDAHINVVKKDKADLFSVQPKSSHPYIKSSQACDDYTSTTTGGLKSKRRAKAHGFAKLSTVETVDKSTDVEEISSPPGSLRTELQDDYWRTEISFSRWEERIGPQELERAVLSLLEFGQIAAAKQLLNKLSPSNVPLEFKLVDAALTLAELSTPSRNISVSFLDEDLHSVLQSYNMLTDGQPFYALQVLEDLASVITEGNGRGLCKRIIAVVKAANVLDISFSEAFGKRPTELLQLLSLKAQDSFEEARLLVQTHSMPTTNIAQILADSFLKGLLAAHRGGYMDSQKEEGPAPLLWRFSDFLKWAELCPSESEIGHALMRLVITGQEIPHACEVELLILSHHFYKASACLDGVDVLVALAATRVEAYVSEGDFSCLARLITGVGNFHALNFILGILIENGQLDLLLQKYSAAASAHAATVEAGFRMAVLTSLKHFNPNDLDAFAMVYNHFDMKHEAAALLLSRARQSSSQWLALKHNDYNGYLLESMRYYIEAAEVYSSIDAGNKTHDSCARASLVSLQIRMPDITWLDLPDTHARRALANQSQFQEALILAEAYNLNQPGEWVPVLWELMLKPEPIEQFVAEFVAVLPLHPSMLLELARFYKNEVVARRDQPQFSVWFAGGLPSDWAKQLERGFRCLLKRTRDLRLRLQLAVQATGFDDVIDTCNKEMDKVPENAGPLVLRKGHGGAYLPLM